jgi:hypothetical protein
MKKNSLVMLKETDPFSLMEIGQVKTIHKVEKKRRLYGRIIEISENIVHETYYFNSTAHSDYYLGEEGSLRFLRANEMLWFILSFLGTKLNE